MHRDWAYSHSEAKIDDSYLIAAKDVAATEIRPISLLRGLAKSAPLAGHNWHLREHFIDFLVTSASKQHIGQLNGRSVSGPDNEIT